MASHGAREPGYAWVVVAVLFLANAVASGTQGSFGLLVRPWETDFGWERAAISLTASIGFVVYGTAQALSGRWADYSAFFAAAALLTAAATGIAWAISETRVVGSLQTPAT